MLSVRAKRKIFVIGRNKTGTSSIAAALGGRGAVVASQASGERLLYSWAERDFSEIVRYCRTAEVFKDVPFGLSYTFQAVDMAFPGSKFVLSVWPSASEWYDAFVGHHVRMFGDGGVPTAEQLAKVDYRWPGFVFDVLRLGYEVSITDPYNRAHLIEQYERHGDSIRTYFEHRPDDLLELDIGQPGARGQLYRFVGLDSDGEDFILGEPDVGYEARKR